MHRQLLPIAALLTSTFFMLAGGGVQWTLLPIRSQIEGFSNDAIGLMGAAWAIGFSAGCLVVPRIVRRVGHVRTFSSLLALVAISILMAGLFVDPYAWFVFRAVGGLCFSGSYMIIESWLNERVTNETRGAIFSFYLVVTEIGMIAGQYVIVFAAPESEAPFMVAAVLFACAILPTALSTAQSPAPLAEANLEIARLFANSPAAVVGVLLSGVLAGAWQNFAPVYGTMSGLSTAAISTILAVSLVGSALAQFPFGWISDRMDRRFVLIAIGVGGAITCWYTSQYEVNGADPGWWFFIQMAVIGAFIYPVYAVLVAHANDRAAPGEYVRISSGLLIVYGAGTMIGPLATARTISAFGAGGLFITMSAVNLLLAIYVFWRLMRRRRPRADAPGFQTIAPAVAPTPQSYALTLAGEPSAKSPRPPEPQARAEK